MDRPSIFPVLIALLIALSPAFAAPAPETPGQVQQSLASLTEQARLESLIQEATRRIDKKDYSGALATAEEAVAIAPGHPVVQNIRGATLVELGRFDEAEAIFDRILEENPNLIAVAYNKGEILVEQGNYSDAAVYFRTISSRFGVTPLLKFKIYLCYLLNNQRDLSGQMLKAFKFPLDGAAWYFSHAAEAFTNGDIRKGRTLMAAGKEIHGDESQIYSKTLEESGIAR